jgi:tetratricopeptide (TPR) repeat protein
MYHILSKICKEEVGDKYGLALSYYNIGLNQIRKNNYRGAEENLFKALKLSEEVEDIQNISRIYLQLATIEIKNKRYAKSKDYSDKSLSISLKTNSKELVRDAYFSQIIIDSLNQNWKSAFYNYNKFIAYRDSLINDENNKAIVQQQMQYDFDKKEAVSKEQQEKERALSDADKKQKKIIIWSAGLGIIVLIIFLISINNRFRLTKKQKMVIEEQKIIVDIKQKEILDSIHYAKRIQSSLLPTEKYIDKSLNRLKK